MKATQRTLYLFLALITALAVLAASSADAAFYRWTNPDGGDWNDNGNWDYPGYPSLFFDFALFDLDATYIVNAGDRAAVERIAGMTLAAGDITLQTHDAFEAIVSIGPGADPASLTLTGGAINSPAPHVIGPHGAVILRNGARLTSRATDSYGFVVETGGVLGGDGVLDGHLLRNMGTVRPGVDTAPAGAIVIGTTSPGGYDQRDSGVLRVEIRGAEAGVGFGQLRVMDGSRGVTLNGTLEILPADGFVPAPGDRYEVFTAPAYEGAFTTVIFPDLPDREFELLYEPSAVVVAVSGPSDVVLTLDIQPGACPNPLSMAKQGVIPVALMGMEGFDVRDIDVATITLEGVAPVRHGFRNAGSPADDGPCLCLPPVKDGLEDLTLKFPAPELTAALGPVIDREERLLTLTGSFVDGTPFVASDCVLILAGSVDRGKGRTKNAEAAVDVAGDSGLSPAGRPSDRVQWVAYTVSQPVPVRLCVFDVAGRLVATLVNEVRPAGRHQVQWDASGRPSGVYFYRMTTPDRIETARTVLIRR